MRFGGQQALGSAGFAVSWQRLEKAAESDMHLSRLGRITTRGMRGLWDLPCRGSGFSTKSLCLCLQRCCHCCLLGRAAQAQGQSCEYSLMVGYQCGLVFRACCVKGQETAEFAPGDGGDLQETGKSPFSSLWGRAVSRGYLEKQKQ